MSKSDKILWSVLVTLSLAIVIILALILNTPNKKNEYTNAYVEISETNIIHYDIEYYYFEDDMIVVVTVDGRTIKTSKDNVTLYKVGE